MAIAALAVSQDEFQDRRAKLRGALPDSAIVVIGSTDQDANPRRPYLQDANFLYLTGWEQPGAVLLILPTEEILFLPPRSERKERYEGRRAAPGDMGVDKLTGFGKVLSTDVWEAELRRHAASVKQVYTVRSSTKLALVENALPKTEIKDVTREIARLRMKKSAREVELLQHAIDVSIEMHRESWKRAHGGLHEYQIEATMTSPMVEAGCRRMAYPPIIGSGPNSVILHYSANRRRMDQGELLLMDAGAECSNYAADLTRTIPVSGKFTPRQREIYEIVLGAQKAAILAAKPGATIGTNGTLTNIARDYINAHGKDLNGQPLGKYFTHGIGHHVGLEVHDAWVPDEPLASGMVITIEPGIYIPDENIGIRIEDMILITPEGSKVLSAKLPREVKDMERRAGK